MPSPSSQSTLSRVLRELKATPDKRAEWIGGMTTFFTMCYIVVVNPAVLSANGATGLDFDGVLTATVLLSLLMTLMMGLYAKLPYAVAPGMGINAFFAYSLIIGEKVPWPVALGLVCWAGIVFLAISLTGLRDTLARAIPPSLRTGSAVGIGLFLALIGFKNAGLVVANPETFVQIAPLGIQNGISLLGLFVILFLMRRKNPFAFIGGIAFSTICALGMGLIEKPASWFSYPKWDTVFFKADLVGSLKWQYLPVALSILFTDLFDSVATFVGVSQATKLQDTQGQPLHMRQGLIVDAWATLTAGLFGTSSGTAYIESAAGIEAGARTGFASVVTALFFLPCFFVAPLAASIPAFATAPVLIIIGALMFRSISSLDFSRIEDLLPPFLTLSLIPLSFSITKGMIWGFISHTTLYVIAGRHKEIEPALWVTTALCVLLLAL